MFAIQDYQLPRACRALLATVGLEDYWTSAGPTATAVQVLERDGGSLARGARVALLAAFALWYGRGTLRLDELLIDLDRVPRRAFCTLVLAADDGPGAVDAWLATHEATGARGTP